MTGSRGKGIGIYNGVDDSHLKRSSRNKIALVKKSFFITQDLLRGWISEVRSSEVG